jgi:hypothetical protein
MRMDETVVEKDVHRRQSDNPVTHILLRGAARRDAEGVDGVEKLEGGRNVSGILRFSERGMRSGLVAGVAGPVQTQVQTNRAELLHLACRPPPSSLALRPPVVIECSCTPLTR